MLSNDRTTFSSARGIFGDSPMIESAYACDGFGAETIAKKKAITS